MLVVAGKAGLELLDSLHGATYIVKQHFQVAHVIGSAHLLELARRNNAVLPTPNVLHEG